MFRTEHQFSQCDCVPPVAHASSVRDREAFSFPLAAFAAASLLLIRAAFSQNAAAFFSLNRWPVARSLRPL